MPARKTKPVTAKKPKKLTLKIPYGNANDGDLISVDGKEYSLESVYGDGKGRRVHVLVPKGSLKKPTE